MITLEQFERIAGSRAAIWYDPLIQAMQKFNILSPIQQAMFIAQVAHESGMFRLTEESFAYRPERLTQIFPKYFKTQADVNAVIGKPQAIANRVYANRMGNGDAGSGDGFKYRGRGLIQLTGRTNYTLAANALNVDLINYPDAVAQPEYAALTAAWFWYMHGCNDLASQGKYESITRAINGGTIGLQERLRLLAICKQAIGIA